MARPPRSIQRALEAIQRTAFGDIAGRFVITLLRDLANLIPDLAPEVADQQALAHALTDVLRNFSEENITYVLGPASAPNWIGLPSEVIGDLRMLQVADLANVASDGIPVTWTPRASILNQLVAAADISSRRNLLLSHESEILDDCIAAINSVKNGPFAEPAVLLTEATIAARAGHHSAAQALASNVLDTVLRITYPERHRWYPKMRQIIADLQSNREVANLRTGLALAPIMLAIGEYNGQGAIPDFFNRHATAHAAGQLQYTRINAIIAIMTATSALRECHELKSRQYRGARRWPRGRPL